MRKKILILSIALLFLFFSGCTQSAPHFTNALEENISKTLIPGASTKDVWDALAKAKIPEKIGYRPPKVWIIAEIDTINETWIAIDVEQKEIIHEGENASYFSGISFNSYEAYQKALDSENYIPLTFSPIHTTVTIVPITSSPTPYAQSYSTELNINSIFIEVLIGSILGFIAVYLIGFDAPGALGGIVVIFGITTAGLALINSPSTDLAITSIKLLNFIGTWAMECVKMSLGAAIGVAIGAIVTSALNCFHNWR